MAGDISRQNIRVPRGSSTYPAFVRWIDDTHFSYSINDWYQGAWWWLSVIDVESGEYDFSIDMYIPSTDAATPWFDWNPSYTAYMLFTDEGIQITRLLEEPDRISYDIDIEDFVTGVETQNYIFTDIVCEGYGWRDDRYFSCTGNGQTIIDSYTGETSVEPLPEYTDDTSFYDLVINYDSDTLDVIDTSTGIATITLYVPDRNSDLFGVIPYGDSGLMTRYQEDGIRFWDVTTGQELLHLVDSSTTAMSFHPDGHILAVGTSTGLVHLYGVPQSEE